MIRVRDLSKRYMIYPRPLDRLLDRLRPAPRRRGRPLWAVRDLTFDVPAGCSLGVVGINGAGKSTLLKILTGTTLPTAGTFAIQGRISSLLELGTGFHPDFTGRQNIFFNGKMAGLAEAELDEKFQAIADFSELGAFIDQPVRTYSSGMVLRLGFALASSVDPDVLIIDEALAVGDLHFQQKCLRRMREFHERGVTILFVSHDPSMIKNFCDQAILLDEGRMIDRGRPDQVLDYYTALLAEKYRDGGRRAIILRPIGDEALPESTAEVAASSAAQSAAAWTAPPLQPHGHRTGNFRAVITSVYLDSPGAHGNLNIMSTGSTATLHVRWVALEPIPAATVGIAIKDRLGQEMFGVNTRYREVSIPPVPAGRAVDVRFRMPMDLGEGLFSITAAVHTGEDHTRDCFDWVEQAATFQILPNPEERFTGLCRLRTEIEVQTMDSPGEELAFARRTRQTHTES